MYSFTRIVFLSFIISLFTSIFTVALFQSSSKTINKFFENTFLESNSNAAFNPDEIIYKENQSSEKVIIKDPAPIVTDSLNSSLVYIFNFNNNHLG